MGTLAFVGVAFAATALLCPPRASAQFGNASWPIAVEPAYFGQRCEYAPAVCDGHTLVAPGNVEIFIYLRFPYEPITAAAFSIDYPSEWSVLRARSCEGAVTEGDIYQPRNGLHITFAQPFDCSRPVLKYLVSAPTVGRWQFAPTPDGLYGCWTPPNGHYHLFWGPGSYLDVGNVCGDAHLRFPCDTCELVGYIQEPAASFSPPSLAITVPQHETLTVPLLVIPGGTCVPPQGCGYPRPCFQGFSSNSPWLSFIDAGGNGNNYLARLDTTLLTPGVYHGSAEAEGPRCCQSVCWPVELTVIPSTTPVDDSARQSTWGTIKSMYR